jgi:hypothetical protein
MLEASSADWFYKLHDIWKANQSGEYSNGCIEWYSGTIPKLMHIFHG